MDILQMVKDAREKLRATQINWQEECLFECDDILTGVIRELESAQQSVHTDPPMDELLKELIEATEKWHGVEDCKAEGRLDCRLCKVIEAAQQLRAVDFGGSFG